MNPNDDLNEAIAAEDKQRAEQEWRVVEKAAEPLIDPLARIATDTLEQQDEKQFREFGEAAKAATELAAQVAGDPLGVDFLPPRPLEEIAEAAISDATPPPTLDGSNVDMSKPPAEIGITLDDMREMSKAAQAELPASSPAKKQPPAAKSQSATIRERRPKREPPVSKSRERVASQQIREDAALFNEFGVAVDENTLPPEAKRPHASGMDASRFNGLAAKQATNNPGTEAAWGNFMAKFQQLGDAGGDVADKLAAICDDLIRRVRDIEQYLERRRD